MPCVCAIARPQRSATTSTPLSPNCEQQGSPLSAAPTPAPSSSSSRCFHCLCSVCGRDVPGIPVVTCDTCGSQTHITCARDAYSHEWLLGTVVGTAATSAAALPNPSPNTTAAVGKTSSPVSAPTTVEGRPTDYRTGGAPSPTLSRELPDSSPSLRMLPSPQKLSMAAAKIGKEYKYYCHPDCAMRMEVLRNPQFSPTISARIERAFAQDWRDTWKWMAGRLGGEVLPAWEDVVSASAAGVAAGSSEALAHVGNGSVETRCGFVERDTSLKLIATIPSPKLSMMDRLRCAAGGDAALADGLLRLYGQLRAEAWAEYFEQERHHSGHPLFYPPPFLDVQREAAVNHVLDAASPQGQAARLYLLDPVMHPVGSAVAVPVGVLTRWQQPSIAPLVKVNDTNNFVAEAATAVADDAETPEMVTVYRNCNKEGRVIASSRVVERGEQRGALYTGGGLMAMPTARKTE